MEITVARSADEIFSFSAFRRSTAPRPRPIWPRVPNNIPVVRQNPDRRTRLDPVRISSQSQLDDHAAAPPASAPSRSLRRPSPAGPGEPRLAPAARRLQANDDPAPITPNGPPRRGRADSDLGRLEAVPRHRYPRHRSTLATASLPRVLDP